MSDYESMSAAELNAEVARRKGAQTGYLGASPGEVRFSRHTGVPVVPSDDYRRYAPATDWRDCGPLLVEVLRAKHFSAAFVGSMIWNQHNGLEQVCEFPEGGELRAFTIAWLKMKEAATEPPD